MIKFTAQIAGTAYGIQANFPSTKTYCKDFLTDLTEDCGISVSLEDMAVERHNADHACPDAYLETVALLRKIAECAPVFDSLLVHGSAISVEGKAYLFTAPSGTGKSTHAALWRQLLGDRAVMINDDKPFIFKKNGVLYIAGSPWNGKHNLGNPISAPLAGICFLSQSPVNKIEKLSVPDAMPKLMCQCYMPKNAESAMKTLSMIDDLLNTVPFYRLECNISQAAAELSYNTMK